jgi:hypothetical protein
VEREDIQEDEHEGMQGEELQMGDETSGQVREIILRGSSTYSKSATPTLP